MKIITDIWSLVERNQVRINVANSHQKEVQVGYSEIMQTEYIKSIACNSISTQPYLICVLLQLLLSLYVTMMTGMNEDKTLHLYCGRYPGCHWDMWYDVFIICQTFRRADVQSWWVSWGQTSVLSGIVRHRRSQHSIKLFYLHLKTIETNNITCDC